MNKYFARRFVVQGIILAVTFILLLRLFYIQIIDKSYYLSAQDNVLRRQILFPARGPIYDRNGKILVQNEPVYDILVIPNEVKPFDTVEFCRLLKIDRPGFDKRFKKAVNYSRHVSSIFEKQLSAVDYATLQERLSEFPGFFEQKRSVRIYPDSVAAHFLGYTLEVNDEIIKKTGGYYQPGDYIGYSGVEKAYEELLRGQRGVKNLLVDAFNRPKGHFADGKYDTAAIAGEKLISSLDLRIQKLGEQLMKDKVGSIVAIEPATGEILAFVSSPTYDPNLMVGKQRGNNTVKMYQDPYKPFLVRPIQAGYSPGSSFKPVDGLIALQEGLITPATTFFCPHYYQAGNHRVACEHFDGVTDLRKGIAVSCNTYFCYAFDKLINKNGYRNTRSSFIDWHAKVSLFGLGDKLGIDLPSERKGNVPTDTHYDKIFGANRWRSSSIISLAIGQGELLATPLQLANIECIIANRGYYYTPHLIKAIGEKKIVKPEFTVRHAVGVDAKHFEPVIDGMQQVVESGTAYQARIPGIIMCGKTGTVQNPHGKNHSVFVAFAPRDNPKIAIAVVVENAGYGASFAAPIASYIVEKYLRDSISKPRGELEYIRDLNLMPALKGSKPKTKLSPGQKDSLKRDSAKKAKPVLKSVSAKPVGGKEIVHVKSSSK